MTTLLHDMRHPLERLRGLLAARGIHIEMTERTKVLLAALAGVVIISAWIGMARMAETAEARFRQATADLARLENQVAAGSWADRKKQSQALKADLESRFWTAQTAGLAEASFERWIRTQMTRAKIEPQQIQIQRSPLGFGGPTDPARSSGIERMTAKVVMPFQSAPLLAFLETAAENGRIAMIERLSVRSGRNARAEMDITTFIRLSDTATEAAP